MEYTFDIVGVSPVLSFFNHQQTIQKTPRIGAEYLGAYRCTLDAFIASVETIPMRQGWNLDRIVDSVVNFWLNNAEMIGHWRYRLEDAGAENLLIGRVASLDALRAEFESLLGYDL